MCAADSYSCACPRPKRRGVGALECERIKEHIHAAIDTLAPIPSDASGLESCQADLPHAAASDPDDAYTTAIEDQSPLTQWHWLLRRLRVALARKLSVRLIAAVARYTSMPSATEAWSGFVGGTQPWKLQLGQQDYFSELG